MEPGVSEAPPGDLYSYGQSIGGGDGGVLQITSVEPVYDKYGHVMAVNVGVKNAGDKIIRLSLTAQMVRTMKKGRFGKTEEKGTSQTFNLELSPGEEQSLEMVIHPAISTDKNFTLIISGSVEESSVGE
mgnify:CR=1 FL=1